MYIRADSARHENALTNTFARKLRAFLVAGGCMYPGAALFHCDVTLKPSSSCRWSCPVLRCFSVQISWLLCCASQAIESCDWTASTEDNQGPFLHQDRVEGGKAGGDPLDVKKYGQT